MAAPNPKADDAHHGLDDRTGCLTIAASGEWLAWTGQTPVSLRRRPTLGRILAVLAAQRIAAPGLPVPAAALHDAGWPGDRSDERSLTNRLRVSMTYLRHLGLGHVLRADRGYLLDPSIEVVVELDRTRSGWPLATVR